MTDAAGGPFALSIDPAASAPPYEQLRRQVVEAVTAGSLAPGTRMPTVRALATELDLAVNTVAKAYKSLEADGVIEGRGRAGTFVSATGDPSTQQAQLAAIAYADRVHHLGLDDDAALALVASALRARAAPPVE
ncbi:GntR family transcriptional regulator [Agromyces aureus]|uniref:GntR family transcriptional regulator n=1 Tax=Agromyces aureus TaxID=453304 RepID=A0A191WBD5_9MICO|nr:GntR family transcriptional regulator [Agromyces aureus]ANJ25552.1 GntR family transcriptional regulator [Agromyces aureus]